MASSISVGEVYEIISKTVAPAGRVIELPLDEANGKFLAECVTSPTPVPLFNNSAMDGYAFNSAILETCADKCRLLVKGASYAGTPPDQTIDPQAALKVMTGAYVPSAYDTVIPYEKVNAYDENDQNFIEFSVCDIKPKVNLRLKGEEIAAGDTRYAPWRCRDRARCCARAFTPEVPSAACSSVRDRRRIDASGRAASCRQHIRRQFAPRHRIASRLGC